MTDAPTPASPARPLLFLLADPADAPAAALLAKALEARGFAAWTEPLADPDTDMLNPPSMAALEGADRAVVIVSGAAAGSDRIEKALIVAGQLGKPLVALRWIDTPAAPPPLLARATWLGPAGSPDAAAQQVAALLQPPIPRAVAAAPAAASPASPASPRKSRVGWAVAIGFLVLAAAGAGAALMMNLNGGRTQPPPPMVASQPPAAVAAPIDNGPAPAETTPLPQSQPAPIRAEPAAPTTSITPSPQLEGPADADRNRSAPAPPRDEPRTETPAPSPRPAADAPPRRPGGAYSPSRDGAVPPAAGTQRPAGPGPRRTGPADPPRDLRRDDPLPPGFGPAPRERRRGE